MSRILRTALAAFALATAPLAVVAAPQTAHAQTTAPKPNILVMGEDADTDSVPRGNRVFNRVIQALAEDMNVAGYNVYDETAIAMGITQPNRVRRRDAELIDIARSVSTPVDVVAIFSIYASASDSAYSDIKRPNIRIPGRLLNVRTGQQIGSFEVSGLQLPPLPVACDRECVLEKVGDSASTLGTELSAALTSKLDGFIAPAATGGLSGTVSKEPTTGALADPNCGGLPTAYVLRFDGFDEAEITALEEYIAAYSCVSSQRPVRASARSAEYWYETRSDAARLNRNLRLTVEHMGLGAQVGFAGNTFVVKKVATR